MIHKSVHIPSATQQRSRIQKQNQKITPDSILIMKTFIAALALASSYALAAPAEQLFKRASVSDVRLTQIPFPL